jgi:hypothetical protein
MKFESRKGKWVNLLLAIVVGSLIFPVAFILVKKGISIEILIVSAFSLITFYLITNMYFNTYYEIRNKDIYMKSGVFSCSVPIEKIKKIEHTSYILSGFKPALDFNGIVIYYGFDEVYISPKNQEEFIQSILKINSKIEVV